MNNEVCYSEDQLLNALGSRYEQLKDCDAGSKESKQILDEIEMLEKVRLESIKSTDSLDLERDRMIRENELSKVEIGVKLAQVENDSRRNWIELGKATVSIGTLTWLMLNVFRIERDGTFTGGKVMNLALKLLKM